NVGIKLGVECDGAYTYDVDIDSKTPGAAQVVTELLPDFHVIAGRPSNPSSHLIGLSTSPITHTEYRGAHGQMLLEVRGLTAGKRTAPSPRQSVVLGTHGSGERIQFEKFDLDEFKLARFPHDEVVKHAQCAAVGLVILASWPSIGKRH